MYKVPAKRGRAKIWGQIPLNYYSYSYTHSLSEVVRLQRVALYV